MRTLSPEARHERRVQLTRPRKGGMTLAAIAAQTGPSRTGVFNICARYASGGAKALRDKAGGRKVGEQRRLTAAQEAQIRRLICDKTPDQLKMPYALWTRGAVAELVEHRSPAGAHDGAVPVALGLYPAKADPARSTPTS